MKNLVLKTCGSISSGSIIIGKVNLPSGSFNQTCHFIKSGYPVSLIGVYFIYSRYVAFGSRARMRFFIYGLGASLC